MKVFLTGRGPYPAAKVIFPLHVHFRMKIVEKGKNMQVHADFFKLTAFGHVQDLCNHGDYHYSLDCFSMTKSNFSF